MAIYTIYRGETIKNKSLGTKLKISILFCKKTKGKVNQLVVYPC
jgi:hypothetical protein